MAGTLTANRHSCVNLTALKASIQTVIHPYRLENNMCTLMLLSNLAEPEWVYVNCTDNLLADAVCVTKTHHKSNNENIIKESTCDEGAFLQQNICYLFLRHDLKSLHGVTLKNRCKNKNMYLLNRKAYKNLHFVFDTVSTVLPPIIFPHESSTRLVYRFKYRRHMSVYKHKTDLISAFATQGFYVCTSNTTKIMLGLNIFHCIGKGYISYEYFCDNSIDCPNNDSDEVFCKCNDNHFHSSYTQMCKYTTSKKVSNKCSPLYYMESTGICSKFYPLNNEGTTQKVFGINNYKVNETLTKLNISFMCKSGLVIAASLVDDLFADCGPEAEDEPELLTLLSSGKKKHCNDSIQIQCMNGHSKCFAIVDICVYKLNKYGHMTPCRNGGHLNSCIKFECNIMFKCEQSYCLPWMYVCDGKWDCPKGDDEQNEHVCGNKSFCQHLFKCKNTKHTCLHLRNICDKSKDCPLGDDELLCDLHSIKCPPTCQCLTYAIKCMHAWLQFKSLTYPHVYISITYSNLQNIQYITRHFKQTTFLHLPFNNINKICKIKLPKHLVTLDMSHNTVKNVKEKCIASLEYLKQISINDNKIVLLEHWAFFNLTELLAVNLSGNPIFRLPEELIKASPKIIYISLQNNTLNDINVKVFIGLQKIIIDTNNYHICCIAPSESHCVAPRPSHVSCDHLLPTSKMKIFFMFISLMILGPMAISTLLQYFAKHLSKAFSTIVMFIKTSDILCAFYFCIIWVADFKYQGSFLVKEESWRSSPMCFVALGTIIWFTILTQMLLIFFSLSRLMVVIYPIDTNFKRTKFVSKYLTLIVGFSFLICLIFAEMLFKEKIPISLCLPFVDPTNSIIAIKSIIWFTAITQLITSIVIIALHIILIFKLQESQKNIRKSKPADDSNILLIIQLVTITLSNILCWIPCNVIYITAIFLSQYPTDLIIWTTVGGLPVNSIVNPTVFIITSIRKYIKFKLGAANKIKVQADNKTATDE